MKFNVFFIGLCLFISCSTFAAEKTTIRIGVQASGTLEWELSALQDDPHVKSADFQLEIQHVANAEASDFDSTGEAFGTGERNTLFCHGTYK